MSILLAAVTTVASLSLPVTSLAGNARLFPRDASRPRAIYVVTFSKAATAEASEWTRTLRARKDVASSELFQVAVLEAVPRLFRSVVVSSMKAEIPKLLHDHFWVATSAGKKWEECADASNLDEAHVFVLDQGGNVIWRSHGPLSALKLLEFGKLPRSQ
jgi:hypothetical protein